MKLFKSLFLPVLFVTVLFFTGCNEEPTISETVNNIPTLSKLTIPAGAVVTNATFNVYSIQNQTTTVNVHKVLVPWVEATETFNTFFAKPAPQWNAAVEGSFDASAVGWHSADVTALVQSWIADPTTNFGLLLDQPSWLNCPVIVDPPNLDYKFIQYHSRENVNVPYLEVTYTLNGSSVTVQEAVFGDTYLHSADPDFPRGAVDVLFQTRWDDPSCTLLKLPLFIFDIEQEPNVVCGTGYAYGGAVAVPFCGLPDAGSNNWGWTNLINTSANRSYEWPIYVGAGQCDISKGTLVGTLYVDYDAATDKVTIDYSLSAGYTASTVHLWIGSEYLPKKNNGKWNFAPGQFNHNDKVYPYTPSGTYPNNFYIAAHFGICWEE